MTLEPFATHEVFNQTTPFVDVNLAALDKPLLGALEAFGDAGAAPSAIAQAAGLGAAENFELARLANENPPKLKVFNARGERQDFVEFHPAYHALMRQSIAAGLASSTFEGSAALLASGKGKPRGKEHVARSALHYLMSGIEAGHLCPVTMTHAGVAALAVAPTLLKTLMPRVGSRIYDASFKPFWEKRGVTLGMGMTEKQGGSDVRANTTRAEHVAADEYEITGHKWFLSAPMCDAFLILAQAAGGLTCFLMPRFRPDGTLNALRLQRLKDKAGNRSNASSEAEFAKAFAWRIGEEGRGVPTIIEMVRLTRLDCITSSAGLMRMGLALAMHHARHRIAFQRKLVDQPAMRATLADLALSVEAATAVALRLALAFDRAGEDPTESVYARLITPAIKFAVCKAAPGFLYEAMECLGGNGYVEESPIPRLYREAPVNAIWEGSGNIMALDVLRAARRDGEGAERLLAELARETQDLPEAETLVQRVKTGLARRNAEGSARCVTQALAMLAAAAALTKCAPPSIAEAFARTRFHGGHSLFGVADLESECGQLLERALPAG